MTDKPVTIEQRLAEADTEADYTPPAKLDENAISAFGAVHEERDFKRQLDRRLKNRNVMIAWIRDNLQEGIDYGRIHVVKDCENKKRCTDPYHFSKPSLWKPGAEKICGMLGWAPTFPNLRDYTLRAKIGKPIETIVLQCVIRNHDGQFMGEGIGARDVSKDYNDLNKALKMAKKCLGGRTPVLARTTRGAVRTDIHRLWMLYQSNDKTEIYGPSGWRRIVDMHPNGPEPTRLITLQNGSQIVATLEHRWPIGTTKPMTMKSTDELVVGDELRVELLPHGDNMKADPSIGWLAGLFVAEGVMNERETSVDLHLHADEEKLAMTAIGIVEKLGARGRTSVDGNKRLVRLSGAAAAGVIKQFVDGKGSHKKHFSRHVFRQGEAFIAAALDGYLAGDGCYQERGGRQPEYLLGFTGKNRELRDDIKAICAILGRRCSITQTLNDDGTGNKHPTFVGWIRAASPRYNSIALGRINAIDDPVDRLTYHIEVDGDHLFCLGDGIVTHNSAHIDATLVAAGLSEIFTQDLDADVADDDEGAVADPYTPQARRGHNPYGDTHIDIEVHCPIGKEWRGRPWDEVDSDFLEWMLNDLHKINKLDESVKPRVAEIIKAKLAERGRNVDADRERERTPPNTGGSPELAQASREIMTARNVAMIDDAWQRTPDRFKPPLRKLYEQTREKLKAAEPGAPT